MEIVRLARDDAFFSAFDVFLNARDAAVRHGQQVQCKEHGLSGKSMRNGEFCYGILKNFEMRLLSAKVCLV